MSCCAGRTQTRKMTVVVNFRPRADLQYRLRIELQGRNGSWQGRATGRFNFGDSVGCGSKAIGIQDISIKLKLDCTPPIAEGDATMVSGTLDLTMMKSIRRFTLPSTVLNCLDGGPKCEIVWPELFINEYLGGTAITIAGDGL